MPPHAGKGSVWCDVIPTRLRSAGAPGQAGGQLEAGGGGEGGGEGWGSTEEGVPERECFYKEKNQNTKLSLPWQSVGSAWVVCAASTRAGRLSYSNDLLDEYSRAESWEGGGKESGRRGNLGTESGMSDGPGCKRYPSDT